MDTYLAIIDFVYAELYNRFKFTKDSEITRAHPRTATGYSSDNDTIITTSELSLNDDQYWLILEKTVYTPTDIANGNAMLKVSEVPGNQIIRISAGKKYDIIHFSYYNCKKPLHNRYSEMTLNFSQPDLIDIIMSESMLHIYNFIRSVDILERGRGR